jgi:hypothetical protein
MDDDELTKLRVEAWKTTVQVQQHFNDIELRIRNLAITVFTAVVGAAALAVEQGKAPLGAVLLVLGVLAMALFWFVDEVWYHQLLIGSVKRGASLEDSLPSGFGLTHSISEASAWKMPFGWSVPLTKGKKELHSTHKLRIFYVGTSIILLGLAVAAVLFGLGSAVVSRATASPTPVVASPTPNHTH